MLLVPGVEGPEGVPGVRIGVEAGVVLGVGVVDEGTPPVFLATKTVPEDPR